MPLQPPAMPSLARIFTRNIDFIAAAGSMTATTVSVVQRHIPSTNSLNLPAWSLHDLPSADLRTPALVQSRTADIGTLASSCLASVLLTFIYNRGRGEQHHAELVASAVAIAAVMVITTEIPVDIILFGVFPWLLTLALLISRIWEQASSTEGDGPADEKRLWSDHGRLRL